MANVMANICSVKGMGPKGTTTQADTAMMAMVKPTKTTDRVRWVASLRVFVDSMHLSFHSKKSIVGDERVASSPRTLLKRLTGYHANKFVQVPKN